MKHTMRFWRHGIPGIYLAIAVCGCGRAPQPAEDAAMEPAAIQASQAAAGQEPQGQAEPAPEPETAAEAEAPERSPESAAEAVPADPFEAALAEILRLEQETRFSEAIVKAGELLAAAETDERRRELRRLEYRLKVEKKQSAGLDSMVARLGTDDSRSADLARSRIERAGEAGILYLRQAVRKSPADIAAPAALILLDLRDEGALEPVAQRFRESDDEALVRTLTDVLKQLRIEDVQARLYRAWQDTVDPEKAELMHTIYAHVRARNNRYLELTAELNGRVSENTGWHPVCSNVTIQAFPEKGYSFLEWLGDVPTNEVAVNPLVLEMDQTRTIQARFVREGGQYRFWNTNAGSWDVAAAWTPAGVPGPNDTVRITNGQVTVRQAIDVDMLLVDGATVEVEGWEAVNKVRNTIILGDKTVLRHAANKKTPEHRLRLVCRRMLVETGAVVTAAARGFEGGTGEASGPGAGVNDRNTCSGGAHGGFGGRSTYAPASKPYDSLERPSELGSGSAGHHPHGNGGDGGGVIELGVAEALKMNGRIVADGGDATGPWAGNVGGGAGGSIFIRTARLTGAGSIRADGGRGGTQNGGGGGGGRIALHVTDASAFAGTVSADRGTGAYDGDVGTIYLTDPRLLGTAAFTAGGGEWHVKGDTWSAASLTLNNYRLRLSAAMRAGVDDGLRLLDGAELALRDQSRLTCGTLTVSGSTNAICRFIVGQDNRKITGSALDCKGDMSIARARIDQYPGGRVKVAGRLAMTEAVDWRPYCNPTSGVAAVKLEVGELVMGEGCAINADAAGYLGDAGNGRGPGPGSGERNYGSGGAHGGDGGNTVDNYAKGGAAYGDVERPLQPGSSGAGTRNIGEGGDGGGVIPLVVAGSARIDGTLTADGERVKGHYHHSLNAGGGAGGSILIACAAIEGSGVIKADGGNGGEGGGGGGGGGRIALRASKRIGFTGRLSARGGGGRIPGGAGTLWLSDGSALGGMQLRDGGGVVYSQGVLWSFPKLQLSNYDLIVSSGKQVRVKSAVELVDGARLALLDATGLECETLQVAGSSNRTSRLDIGETANVVYNNRLVCREAMTLVSNVTVRLYPGAELRPGTLTLRENVQCFASCHPTNGVTPQAVSAVSIDIGEGCFLDADGGGYAGTTEHGRGPGKGAKEDWSSGGGHGGAGARAGRGNAPGGESYGDLKQPRQPGSSGGGHGYVAGGAGGGVWVLKTGSLRVDGRISADATRPRDYSNHDDLSGGGAGGSIWIEADRLEGKGRISADGSRPGNPGGGGSGGGGRLALHVKNAKRFEGSLSARGGLGQRSGDPGTIYVSDSVILPVTWKDAGGVLYSAGKVWTGLGSLTIADAEVSLSPGMEVAVSGDVNLASNGVVVLRLDSGLQCRNLHLRDAQFTQEPQSRLGVSGILGLAGKSVLRVFCDPQSGTPPPPLKVSDLVVAAGSVLSADGAGFRGGTPGQAGLGPGGGPGVGGYGTGAGYGGAGGPGHGNKEAGQPYGSAEQPDKCGSGGGGGGQHGTRGGGYLRIEAGNVTCDGRISANGAPNGNGHGGCGSGGGILLKCKTLKGDASGVISANGGNSQAHKHGGGGGGGRIAIYTTTDAFRGKVEVAAGDANIPGKPGTIHRGQ